MKTINIALAADNNYAQHVAVVMESILENTVETNKVRFYVLIYFLFQNNIQLVKVIVFLP